MKTPICPNPSILRSIVYIYICKYNETEKVLDLFSRMYKPAYQTRIKPCARMNSVRPSISILSTRSFPTIRKILKER